MAAPRACVAYIFTYAYVIRSTRDAYCDIPLSTTMSHIKQARRGVGNNQCYESDNNHDMVVTKL